jgi:nucleoside-diphosphate-sugar epimerase
MIQDEGAPVTIVRPGWIYGPRDRASFARIARMIETGQMTRVGGGDNHLPLIYVRDAAWGVLLAGESPPAEGRSYLLVNDEPVTQKDFIAAIAAELDAPVPTRRVPYGLALKLATAGEAMARVAGMRRPPPVMRYGIQLLGGENCFSITRAREDLGFVPLVDFDEGVRRSVEWYRRSHEQAELEMVAA